MDEYTIGLGTELKLNLSIERIGDYTMDDYNFVAEVYTSSKRSVSVEKRDAIRIDENNYVLRVDTNILGTGNVKLKCTAHIPDEDFEDGYRTEVAFIKTEFTIIKKI